MLLPILAWGGTRASGTPRAVWLGTDGGRVSQPGCGREGSCTSPLLGEMQILIPRAMPRALCSAPATLCDEPGFAGRSNHIHKLQEEAWRDWNPLPTLGRGTGAALTLQRNYS